MGSQRSPVSKPETNLETRNRITVLRLLCVWAAAKDVQPENQNNPDWRLDLDLETGDRIQVSTPVLLLTSPGSGIKRSICGLRRENKECNECVLNRGSFDGNWIELLSEKNVRAVNWTDWTGLRTAQANGVKWPPY